MSVAQLRVVARSRRTIGDTIANSLIPLEQGAHQTAADANKFISDILRAHTDAGLPPAEGMDIVRTLSDAANLAVQSRVKFGEAHVALRDLAAKHNIVFAGPPECPPNEFFETP